MTGNQIAYATLQETTRHNKFTEKLASSDLEERIRHNKSGEYNDRTKNIETRRHNVNSEIAQTRYNDIIDRYNSEKIRLGDDQNDVNYYKAINQVQYNKDSITLKDREVRNKYEIDKGMLAARQDEVFWKGYGEVRRTAEDVASMVNPLFKPSEYKGGNINGKTTSKGQRKAPADPKEIERRLFK